MSTSLPNTTGPDGNKPSSWRSPEMKEVLKLFLRLGFTAYGGPAAHIAMLHDETVRRRRWLSDQAFLDLVGATNLIPGPNSTELVIHLGYLRAGWRGMLAAGTCFILPAMGLVLALAAVYVRFGSTPAAQWLLYGIKPVVIAIIVRALWALGRKAIQGPLTGIAAGLVITGYFLGFNPIGLLFAVGLLVMVLKNLHRAKRKLHCLAILPFASAGLPDSGGTSFSLLLLFLTTLKIGSVLYGGGYVLLAFLRTDFVLRFGWLTDHQLLDAIAIGQITPGPLFTAVTFIGYLLGGFPGAIAATVGIFLPSFVLVAVSNPFIPRMRRSPWLGALLDGVNAASMALMAAVTWQLGAASLIDPLTVAVAGIALLLVFLKVNSSWLVLGGATVGFLSWVIG